VLSTTSGRGVVSEDHALALVFDAPGASVEYVNQVLERSDLVLALGCKLSRNGSRGYSLVLPADRLVRVDVSTDGLDRHYPASEEIEADVRVVVSALLEGLESSGHHSEWTLAEVASIRDRVTAESPRRLDPRLGPVRARELFEALRRQLPPGGVVTTDSGQHQYVTRAQFRVVEPRTLMVPTGFQSMGFGLPAAIGAAIATGERSVAVVGDGGLAIVGLEIAVAVREGLPLTVVVLADGHFGLIRIAQRYRVGYDIGVDVAIPDLPTFAKSLGADYAIFDGSRSADELFAAAFASDAVTLVEVPMGEPPDIGRITARGRLRAALRRSASSLPRGRQ
jgi:acetolactate synthase-1/2/3 large subunit